MVRFSLLIDVVNFLQPAIVLNVAHILRTDGNLSIGNDSISPNSIFLILPDMVVGFVTLLLMLFIYCVIFYYLSVTKLTQLIEWCKYKSLKYRIQSKNNYT